MSLEKSDRWMLPVWSLLCLIILFGGAVSWEFVEPATVELPLAILFLLTMLCLLAAFVRLFWWER